MNRQHRQTWMIVSIVAGSMLLLATGNWQLATGSWPYAYYQLLRVVVFAASIYGVWHYYQLEKQGWVWALIVTGLVFNPIVPLRLVRSVWQVLDVTAAGVFFFSLISNKQIMEGEDAG